VRYIFIVLFLITFVFAKQCADQYNPEGFFDAPRRLGEIVDNNLKNLKLFGKVKEYKKLHFKKLKISNKMYYVKKSSFVKKGDYIYPLISGLWKYHIDKNGNIDELDIADVFEYKGDVESVANEVNGDFNGLWSRWGGSAYAMRMVPEDAQIRYGSFYLSMTVYLYGVKEDATELKYTTIDYNILNYTNEVNRFIKCKERK
jgi:hypothetical protein